MKDNGKKRRAVQITITENCNLNCTYCYEHCKDLRVLPVGQIKDIVIEIFNTSSEYDEIEFDFHGGEVALVYEHLKEVCQWLWSEERSKPYICFASTNGTLIHGEIQDWFCENKNRFWLGLSLDGTKEMHDINRSNSYDMIDIDFFRECWPEQGIKMTVSPETIPNFSKGVQHIYNLGFKVHANLAYGIEWPDGLRIVYKDQLLDLAEFYLRNPQIELSNPLSFPLHKIGFEKMFPERKESKKWCGAGKQMICFSCSGKRYPCQVFMPSSEIENGDDLFQILDFKNDDIFEDPSCKDCVLNGACPTCYAHNYLATGKINQHPEDLCKFRKIEAAVASYVQGKMIVNHEKYNFFNKMDRNAIIATAKGIELVQKELAEQVNNLK